jgi:hypothetical protein
MVANSLHRPDGDSGIGFTYPVSSDAFGPKALTFWLGELERLGASWLTLTTTLSDPVPEHALRELSSHQLELVVGVDVRPIARVEAATLAALCRHYARAGVRYMYVYDAPNLASAWRYDEWAAPGLVERFSELLIPALSIVASSGMVPVLSPLAPGGDYWDTSFLAQLLGHLVEAELGPLLDRVVLAAYAVSSRPIGWGQGGPERWHAARPYARPADSEDHRGLRLFEWYEAIAVERLGRAMPLLYVGTCQVSDAAAAPSAEAAAQPWALAVVDALKSGEVSDDVLAVNLGRLAATDEDEAPADHWYEQDRRPGALVEQLKARPRTPRRFDSNGATPRVVSTPVTSESTEIAVPSHRPIEHYLLLLPTPVSSSEQTEQIGDLIAAAAAYIARVRPTVGFSVNEAMRSQRVTLAGMIFSDVDQVERQLRLVGCRVDRMLAASAPDLEVELDSLAERDTVVARAVASEA